MQRIKFVIVDAGAARKEGIALIPVLDMLDHNPQQHVAWHTGNTGEENFRFLTKSAIRKVMLSKFVLAWLWILTAHEASDHQYATLQGDQLYSNYGHKSNEELLLGYGFVLEPNTADYFSVSLGLEASSAAGNLLITSVAKLLKGTGP